MLNQCVSAKTDKKKKRTVSTSCISQRDDGREIRLK